jgi:hypothetical protein
VIQDNFSDPLILAAERGDPLPEPVVCRHGNLQRSCMVCSAESEAADYLAERNAYMKSYEDACRDRDRHAEQWQLASQEIGRLQLQLDEQCDAVVFCAKERDRFKEALWVLRHPENQPDGISLAAWVHHITDSALNP